jgi:hypothetical protein
LNKIQRFVSGHAESSASAPIKDLVQNNFPEFSQDGVRALRVEIWNPLPAGEGRVRAKTLDVSTSLSQAQRAQALTPTPLPQGEGLQGDPIGSGCSEISAGDFREVIVGHILSYVCRIREFREVCQ